MKEIYVNLKRFDVPASLGGVNRIAPVQEWAAHIMKEVQTPLEAYRGKASFTMFFPEAHILPALAAKLPEGLVDIGCQGVYREDVAAGKNFGAFTTNRPAAAAQALGCTAVLVGHCEERRDLAGILGESAPGEVDRLLNRELHCALAQGLRVLYCIGEADGQQERWREILSAQLEIGLAGVEPGQRGLITIAYEPLWAIGPGKTPPDKPYIEKIARHVKECTSGLALVYGGGLKADNAAMLASIGDLDGGLVALTRFSGEIGFYPEEFLEIVREYMQK